MTTSKKTLKTKNKGYSLAIYKNAGDKSFNLVILDLHNRKTKLYETISHCTLYKIKTLLQQEKNEK